MATKSILNTIEFKDKASANAFVDALETAKQRSEYNSENSIKNTKTLQMSEIKEFFK